MSELATDKHTLAESATKAIKAVFERAKTDNNIIDKSITAAPPKDLIALIAAFKNNDMATKIHAISRVLFSAEFALLA
eukprot:10070501-Heterocapsa_arctica.AAC.1